MHLACYGIAQMCTWTGVRNRVLSGGESGWIVRDGGRASAPCFVCWELAPPIGYLDGGGVQDQVREQEVHKRIEQLVLAQYPELNYHPVALPENRGGLALDPHTESLLQWSLPYWVTRLPPLRRIAGFASNLDLLGRLQWSL